MSEMIGYVIFTALMWGLGMIFLVVGYEINMRKVFSNPRIIDINTSLSDIDFTKYVEFEWLKLGEDDVGKGTREL